VVILKRLLEPPLFPILYAIIIAYFTDQLRYILVPAGMLSRFTFVFELVAASLFLLWVLRFGRQQEGSPLKQSLGIRYFLHFSIYFYVGAGLANAFGYVHLSDLLGNGMLQCSYLAVIIYAAVRVIEPLALGALGLNPFRTLRVVHTHHALLYKAIRNSVRWIALAIWIIAALDLFSLESILWNNVSSAMDIELKWGYLTVSLGSLVAFGVTIWASFALSTVIRFGLEEEIYPRVQISRGLAYASSSMIHYTLLVVGFFAALEALGIDLTKITVLVGAFGVGLGFGLQNIINNFVAGIILLFERPIKIGDVIQIDNSLGIVDRIGIRASVVRLSNGSDVIVPNGNLISNNVTNWSLKGTRRMIEIPISVTAKADPSHIIQLLKEIALADPRVERSPEPCALLITLAAAGLAFRLRIWADVGLDAMQISSDLSLKISSALDKESIALA
jgi:small-conductance mechanosensitive channel